MKRLLMPAALVLLLGCQGSQENKKADEKDSAQKAVAPSFPKAPSRDSLLSQIHELEKELFSSEQLDTAKAGKMVGLYQLYYQNYHRDLETADFLFKAGELTENINQPYRSIEFYTHCYEEYPMFKYRPECLFRMASLYDYKLKDYIKAKALYEEVKVQFPKSPLAKDAEAAINLMSRSDQEIIREFEKRNGVKK